MNQLEAMGVESTTSITTLGADTPMARNNLSHETLELLTKAADSLENTHLKGLKRKRGDSENQDNRSSYPTESKAIYLKTKNLFRKKLAIATNLHHIKARLNQGKYPIQVDFKCNLPQNRDEKFKSTWQQSIKKCKQELSLMILQDLNEKYTMVKTEILGQLDQLKKILNADQFKETHQFLEDRYKAAMKPAMNRLNAKSDRNKKFTGPRKQIWRTGNRRFNQKQPRNNKTDGNLRQKLQELLSKM